MMPGECVAWVRARGDYCAHVPTVDVAGVSLCAEHYGRLLSHRAPVGDRRDFHRVALDLLASLEDHEVRAEWFRRNPPPAANDGWVYFGRRGELVKIGTSRQPTKRLRSLAPIVLLALEGGGRTREKQLHERFAAHRRRGEWFTFAPEIVDYVADVNTKAMQRATALPEIVPSVFLVGDRS